MDRMRFKLCTSESNSSIKMSISGELLSIAFSYGYFKTTDNTPDLTKETNKYVSDN